MPALPKNRLKLRSKQFRPTDEGGEPTFASWSDKSRLEMDADRYCPKRALFEHVWRSMRAAGKTDQEIHDFLLRLGDNWRDACRAVGERQGGRGQD